MRLTKVIDINDFKDTEMEPYLMEIAGLEATIFKEQPRIIPDSKQWECAMALRTFEALGLFKGRPIFAGIGAGTEATIYALVNRDAIVFPVDKYLESTPWSDVAPAGFMISPGHYSNLAVKEENIVPVSSDCTELRLPSGFFDGVFSSGSIEHFGSLEKVERAATEIARILKPGGIVSISTEFRLDGPYDKPWFDDNVILFTEQMLNKHIVEAGGFEVLDVDLAPPSDETFHHAVGLEDFLSKVRNIKTYRDKETVYPNTVIFHQGFLFCSVHLALRKKVSADNKSSEKRSRPQDLGRLADRLSSLQRSSYMSGGQDPISNESLLNALSPGGSTISQNDPAATHKLQAILNSTSWRITRPLRIVAETLRRFKRAVRTTLSSLLKAAR